MDSNPRMNDSRMDSASRPPLVSILCVVFRDKAELQALIENFAPFRGADLEVIVIDGGSDDGSLEVLRDNSDRIDYWISEPDKGIYDAMNKGIAAARGKWLLHINAGDRLLAVPYEELRATDDSVHAFAARVQCEDLLFIPRVNWTSRFQNTLQHQGTFYRREFHSGYDTSYRVLADFAFNQKMFKARKPVAISRQIVASHTNGGVSNQPGLQEEFARCTRESFGHLHQYIKVLLFRPARRLRINFIAWKARSGKSNPQSAG